MTREDTHQTSGLTDNELINRIVRGEKQLYEAIIRRYNQRLHRIGIGIIEDEAEVEDAMQVAYINAYENLGKFGFKSSFATWLTRILINECILRLKKKGKSMPVSDSFMETALAKHQFNHNRTPAQTTMNKELSNILDEAIRKLPEMYRTVFIMREIEEMNVAETQECLNISEVNVKVRLTRAKAMLRELLAGYYKKEDILHFHLSKCDRMVQAVMSRI
jgi:RNA polymerase sigma-70 factor (ECF subfamily)